MIKTFYNNYRNSSVCFFLVQIKATAVKCCHHESSLFTPGLNWGKMNMTLTETGVWQVEKSFVRGTNTICWAITAVEKKKGVNCYSNNPQYNYMGRFTLRSNPLPLSTLFFGRNGTPFLYLSLTNGTPFTCLVYNFASVLTAMHFL